ncbi:MAG: hypothetical protein P4L99_16505 [Chthoniobacter sp.]|nr:hypothetical protein [Chthoniobacter sp.]
MNIRPALSVVTCLCALATSPGESPNEHHAPTPIADLKTQLTGTSWRAEPVQSLRPGLAPILTFTETAVAPEGYRIEVNADHQLTITFNHGDTQSMQLAPDGTHLHFTFDHREYSYEMVETQVEPQPGSPAITDFPTQLAGTKWKAVTGAPPHSGLAASLSFNAATVTPAGYHYDVNAADSLTIHFNHGDTQLMLLTPDGKRLQFVFRGRDYFYQLVSH